MWLNFGFWPFWQRAIFPHPPGSSRMRGAGLVAAVLCHSLLRVKASGHDSDSCSEDEHQGARVVIDIGHDHYTPCAEIIPTELPEHRAKRKEWQGAEESPHHAGSIAASLDSNSSSRSQIFSSPSESRDSGPSNPEHHLLDSPEWAYVTEYELEHMPCQAAVAYRCEHAWTHSRGMCISTVLCYVFGFLGFLGPPILILWAGISILLR